MSVLRKGDEDLHYSDNSHRWIAPPNIEQNAWDAGMRAHLSLHLTTMGGPVEVDQLRACRPARIPRQRVPMDSPPPPSQEARLVPRPRKAA
ncbi:MAG TPA: hypothetical protein VFE14_01925 [Micromonosporaceae bacterium]|jgi:hypothetical protein|nr:hypothetical protein [Micromonosporaceae bacterium]